MYLCDQSFTNTFAENCRLNTLILRPIQTSVNEYTMFNLLEMDSDYLTVHKPQVIEVHESLC